MSGDDIKDWCRTCLAYTPHLAGIGWIKCDDCGRHTNTRKRADP